MTMDIDAILESQHAFFKSGTTLDPRWRSERLKELARALDKWEIPLCDALWADLHKSANEAFLTEIALVRSEISSAARSVRRWARREKVSTPIACMPARSYIVKEPLGTALIVSPWNYPVQLLLNPLVGAIAAGCTAVLKPSPYVPNVSETIERMLSETFPKEYIAVVQGNREINRKLFSCRWDIIFFTGSPSLGRVVMEAAAPNLTPVVLELGGKSPCIIDRSADVELAARRCAWGKTLNSGQTCIAPDYLLVHRDVKDEFVDAFKRQIAILHGENPQLDKHYARMVSDSAFARVSSYLSEGSVLCGGHTDSSQRYIEPTLLGDIAPDSKVMTEEIFGPVFPMIVLDDRGSSFADKVVSFVTSREKPLAFYYFGDEKSGWDLLSRTSSGGSCINDTIMHIANPNLPFGGVGNSGMGSYHGRLSFEAFTHRRSVIVSSRLIDLPFRYMPYRFFGVTRKLL